MDDSSKRILHRWWQSMMLPSGELEKLNIMPSVSGQKAQLKRCQTVDAAMLTEGFRNLWLSLDENITKNARMSDMEYWAAIAVTLVHIKTDSNNKLAYAAGKKGDGDKSEVSELRFSQLQNAKTADEFIRRLRRMVQQLKGDISPLKTAEDIERWFKEQNQFYPRKADKRISVQWAMDYYRAASGKT